MEEYKLPMFPPGVELETKHVLKALARANRALAELKGYADTIQISIFGSTPKTSFLSTPNLKYCKNARETEIHELNGMLLGVGIAIKSLRREKSWMVR